MRLPLETWYTLREIREDQQQLHIRLVPDYFSAEIADPVVAITVSQPQDPTQLQASLARFRDEPVIDIELSLQSVSFWAEYDDVPTTINGEVVAWERSVYTLDDLLQIVQSMAVHQDQLRAEIVARRKKESDVEAFVVELLRRAEAKRFMTTRSTIAIDTQIQVLERVLGRLRDA
ncbi:MAG TPA: hypothetical protein VLC47_13860 [Burkholderiales bacterium]|nr:hypothetical protein [Burkholderiales bacterium]